MPEFARQDQLVFMNRNGSAHNPVQFSRQWREPVRRAVEENPELELLHELQHTHATLLLRAGVHPKIVSERLGHADVQTTLNIYSHSVRTLQRGAADLVGQLLTPSGIEQSGDAPGTIPRPGALPERISFGDDATVSPTVPPNH
ncbi:tyrosine-type recombinase/integrase [Planctomonas sp. JC2975]|nr:tyrosine-type recombinase/integrase [Planctomonas sp. JC2975]NNC13790.1 tyrosine-type recombinase/integrase [Planctomonas sp. JC2975]